jgi:hypothetical protein
MQKQPMQMKIQSRLMIEYNPIRQQGPVGSGRRYTFRLARRALYAT